MLLELGVDAVSAVCWLQVVPVRVKTYAAPAWFLPPTFLEGAPITTVEPSLVIETDDPNASPSAPSFAVSSAC